MADKPDFDAVFARLRSILEPVASDLVVVHDTPESYYLDVDYTMPNKKPLFFGAVRKGRNYVSFYLMPVYVRPDLLESISPELRKRMQGKSCFNFKNIDDRQVAELEELVRVGMEAYRRAGYIPPAQSQSNRG